MQFSDAEKEVTSNVGAFEAFMLCQSFSRVGQAQNVPASYPYRVRSMIRHGQENCYPIQMPMTDCRDALRFGLSLQATKEAMKWRNRSSTQYRRSPHS
jgi:hypothetical protein